MARRRISNAPFLIHVRALRYTLTTVSTLSTLFTDALFTNIMDNFRSFGFATPDGVCNSYASRGGCDVVPTVDSTCLGPVSVCKNYLLLMGFLSLILIFRRLERQPAPSMGHRHSMGSGGIQSTFAYQLILLFLCNFV